MEEFKQLIVQSNPKSLFILCGVFIFLDIITGYLKSFKKRKLNSSISRDGYIKKISWVVALILGFIIDCFVHTNLFFVGSAIMCIATEGISIYENFGELGISLPFMKYFEKLKNHL